MSPSGKVLTGLLFLLSQLSWCQELIRGCTTLELKSGTLTPQTKQRHFYVFVLYNFTFQMGLIIYVGLLLLTPKILSLPFDSQVSAFLSWAHSYAASTIGLTAGPVEHSPPHQWKPSCGGHLHFRERTFSKSATTFTNNNHM